MEVIFMQRKFLLDDLLNTDERVRRQTYYLTYEEICALKKISQDSKCDLSRIVRCCVNYVLEELHSGILEEMAIPAKELKKKKEECKTRRKSEKRRYLEELLYL